MLNKKKDLKNILRKIWFKENLSYQESYFLMQEMASKKISDILKTAILSSLHHKGETVEEIYGFTKFLRESSSLKITKKSKIIFDTCGTGGDTKNTFNISTITSIILSAMGIPVAKHGNRSITSNSGSADLLEKLGINISLSPLKTINNLQKKNITFLFAPLFHSTMKEFSHIRKELKLRTIFNILGPLINPIHATHQLLGVFDESMTEKMAKVLMKLKVESGMVVHGMDGMDEITLTTKTKITEFKNNKLKNYIFDPRKYGFNTCSIKSLQVNSITESKEVALNILSGKLSKKKSPKNNIVIVNVAACLLICNKAKNWRSAIKIAEEFIASGKALKKLEEWKT